MTIEVQLLRASVSGILIPVQSITYEDAEVEVAKAMAISLLERPDRDPKVSEARVIDARGNQLFTTRVADDVGWKQT